jgi:hypothetical protein
MLPRSLCEPAPAAPRQATCQGWHAPSSPSSLAPVDSAVFASSSRTAARGEEADGPSFPSTSGQNATLLPASPVAFRLELAASPALQVHAAAPPRSSPAPASLQLSTDPATSIPTVGANSAAAEPAAATEPIKDVPTSSEPAVSTAWEAPMSSIHLDPSRDQVMAALTSTSATTLDLRLSNEMPVSLPHSPDSFNDRHAATWDRSKPSAIEPSASNSSGLQQKPEIPFPVNAIGMSAGFPALPLSAIGPGLRQAGQRSPGAGINQTTWRGVTLDSRAPRVQDQPVPGIFSGQEGSEAEDAASAKTTHTLFPHAAAASDEREIAEDVPSSPKTSSNFGEPRFPAKQQASNESRALSSSQTRPAGKTENADHPTMPDSQPETGQTGRKELAGLRTDQPAWQPPPRKAGPSNAALQTAENGLPFTETVTSQNVGNYSSDTAETASDKPAVIEPHIGIDAVGPNTTSKQILLNLAGSGATNVAVHLRERSGRIEVAVRSGDSQLTKSLQSGLGDLVTRLENQGFKTQAWVPASPRQAAAAPHTMEPAASQQHGEHSNGSSGNQQRQSDSNPRRQPRPARSFEQNLADEDGRMK